jgi:hypothetical protein
MASRGLDQSARPAQPPLTGPPASVERLDGTAITVASSFVRSDPKAAQVVALLHMIREPYEKVSESPLS